MAWRNTRGSSDKGLEDPTVYPTRLHTKTCCSVVYLLGLVAGCGAQLHDCCETGGPGCRDFAIAACVCEQSPECCQSSWDADCVSQISELGCGSCDGGVGALREDAHDCCEGGEAGCNDPEIEACVCEQDAYCCENVWDDRCVVRIEEYGCGSCDGDEGHAGTEPHDCCEIGEAGCNDPETEACVCDQDSYCCESQWDDRCVSHVQEHSCGSCGEDVEPARGTPRACSEPGNGERGCGDPEIEACVCEHDRYCCQSEWDEECVKAVHDLGCAESGPESGREAAERR